MTTQFVMEAMMQGGGLRLWLFILCVVVGVAGCGLIFHVTIRHHRRRSAAPAGFEAGEEAPVIHDASLAAEIFWVLIPMLIILGLAGWALYDAWPSAMSPARQFMFGALRARVA